MIDLNPEIVNAIRFACGFQPEAVLLFANEPLDLANAFSPGRVTVTVPVRRGHATDTFRDPAMQGYLDAGCAILLAFETKKDARQFDRFMHAEHSTMRCATHPAPRRTQ